MIEFTISSAKGGVFLLYFNGSTHKPGQPTGNLDLFQSLYFRQVSQADHAGQTNRPQIAAGSAK